jgi:hypothetical protein
MSNNHQNVLKNYIGKIINPQSAGSVKPTKISTEASVTAKKIRLQ